jgi:hypothetical protein
MRRLKGGPGILQFESPSGRFGSALRFIKHYFSTKCPKLNPASLTRHNIIIPGYYQRLKCERPNLVRFAQPPRAANNANMASWNIAIIRYF